MPAEPVFARADELAWEGWPEAQRPERGDVVWKTLIDGAVTPTEALTFGVARLRPGAALQEHRHLQPEVYLVLEGSFTVTIAGHDRMVEPGTAVFIPGNARHGCRNDGDAEARFAYAFAADSFDAIEYVF